MGVGGTEESEVGGGAADEQVNEEGLFVRVEQSEQEVEGQREEWRRTSLVLSASRAFWSRYTSQASGPTSRPLSANSTVCGSCVSKFLRHA